MTEKRHLALGEGVNVAYPHPSSKSVSAVMRGNRSSDTSPEVALRAALHRRGYRFRKNLRISVQGVARRPDIVFTRWKIVVFVDGCFWHSCPTHGRQPRSNSEYWSAKLGRNRARDAATNDAFTSAGWAVVRVWEHEPTSMALALVEEAIKAKAL